jgi:lactate dehydrogenase-like 2-hydroxyacid dehydrogenase
LPALRVISSFGVGFDKLDTSRTIPRGIAVGHTPDVLNDCVADLAFALMLDVARGVSCAERFVRRGDWLKGRFALGTRVSGKRLGIVGLGRIGRAVARRASGFEMEVAYFGRTPVQGVPCAFQPSLTALAAWADFLVVTVAGGAETRHLVDRGVLEALGSQGFLINVSRGTVIDEAALVDALVQGGIGGAGLDVFENEPQVPSALMALDNVVLLPHIASGTHETRQAMADLVLANLHRFFDQGALQCPVPWSPQGTRP